MDYANPDALVSTGWLADRLDDPSVVVLDGTYHLPAANRDAGAEFAREHIPGALRFDIDEVCDKANPLPHMVPPADVFAAAASALGVGPDTRVVAYDVYGMQSAARVWWMFRLFGHDGVSVLDGGLPKWKAEGRATTAEARPARPARFAARLRPDLLRGIDDMRRNVETGGEQILDVRAAGRFTGAEPEPRAGMRSGHMPGSLNLPFGELLAAPHKTWLGAGAIRDRAAAAGLDLDRPVAASCGSGVTACVAALGLYLVGKEDVAVYDGSWSEWGGRDDTPVVGPGEE